MMLKFKTEGCLQVYFGVCADLYRVLAYACAWEVSTDSSQYIINDCLSCQSDQTSYPIRAKKDNY